MLSYCMSKLKLFRGTTPMHLTTLIHVQFVTVVKYNHMLPMQNQVTSLYVAINSFHVPVVCVPCTWLIFANVHIMHYLWIANL